MKENINLETGKVRIKAGSTIGKSYIYDKLSEFLKKYPNIEIEMSGGKTEDSIDELARGNVDVVFLSMPYKDEGRNISIYEYYEDRLVLFATDEYLKSLKFKINNLEDLSKVKLISPKTGSNNRRLLDEFFEKNEIKFNPEYEASNSFARLQLVLNSLGIGIGYEY